MGGVVPGPADDVIIAAHTVTFDANAQYNSITIGSTTSRIAIGAGVNRSLTVSAGFVFTANISATLITVVAGQTLTIQVGTGFRYNVAQSNASFTVSTGTLNLLGLGGVPDSELMDPLTAVSARLFATNAVAATVNTTGRLSVGAGTHQLVTIAGGAWTHQHDGIANFNSSTATAKMLVVSGSNIATISFSGDVSTSTPASSTGIFVMSGTACTAVFTSTLFSSVPNNGGAIMYCSAGTTILSGKLSHMAGTNSLSLWIAGGRFRWENQSVLIGASESFTMICSAGFFDIDGLIIDNRNKFAGVIYGSGNGSAVGCVITCAADAVAGFNYIDPTYIYLTSAPPTLPDEGDVSAGTVYGYAGAERIGTGLILSPGILSAAMALTTVNANVTQISGDAGAADALESMLDGSGGATLTLRNLVIDASGTPGTVGIEVKTSDEYSFAMWDTEFHASIDQGLRFSSEEATLLFPVNGVIQADLYGTVNTVNGNVNGKVLGQGAGAFTGNGVRAELGANAIGASQIANNSLTAAKFSGVFPLNFASLIVSAEGHINRVTTTDIAGNMITGTTIRTSVGLASPNLDSQLASLTGTAAAILEDTGTTLPAQIAALETGGATPAEVWDYLVASTGDDAAQRIAFAVAAQSVFTPFQVAVSSIGPDAIQAYAVNESAVNKIASGVWDTLIAEHDVEGTAGSFVSRLDVLVSTRLSQLGYLASLPANFADLSITPGAGQVTATGESSGLYAIVVQVNDQDSNPVKSVRFWLPGASDSVYTDTFGVARLYADPGTYELRCDVPLGFEPLPVQPIEIIDTDLLLDIQLTHTTPSIVAPAGMCTVTLRVIDQSGQSVSDAVVTHRIVPGFAVIEDEWLINAAPAGLTNSDGLVVLVAARLQVYDFSVVLADNHRVTIRRQTPDLASASLSMMLEV